MAFRQQHRPQAPRQLSFHAPDAAVAATSQPSQPSQPSQLQRRLEEAEEWVLFSPTAPSTARTHTTSTERTPRTAGLSRFSEFGSLDTAARSGVDDVGSFLGTEEELDSLDDGLHAFHEPSTPVADDTVFPNHDGLGSFHPDAAMQDHMWQFERSPRRRPARRRSSVQRHLAVLDGADDVRDEERRQRIEEWRLEQSKAVLEEIERETRRRRRLSMAASVRAASVSGHGEADNGDNHSDHSDDTTQHMSFWQRLTTRVIRDLIGLDHDTLSVIFGESLPEEAMAVNTVSPGRMLQDAVADASAYPQETWQTRVLERVAQELGVLVHQLTEHPGAFSTYQRAQATPEYAGLTPIVTNDIVTPRPASSHSDPSVQFAATFQAPHSDASLWGIEEESDDAAEQDASNAVDDAAREREYWERDLDVKMILNFLVRRFTSRSTPSTPTPTRRPSLAADSTASARRAAMIRQNHPLVHSPDRSLPTSSPPRRRDPTTTPVIAGPNASTFRTHFSPPPNLRQKTLRSGSSCASQSTKMSKRSGSSRGNYWDFGGGSGVEI